MTNEMTAVEMRNRIIAELYGEASDKHRADTPFTRDDYAEMAKLLTGQEPDEDDPTIAVQGTVLTEVGREYEWEERGTGPFNKDEMSDIIEAFESISEPDNAFSIIGTEDKEKHTTERDLEYIDPLTSPMRYKTLVALARLGPDTASNLGHKADAEAVPKNLTWSTVESELPRLYRMKLAERSKRPGFEDVYTYWLSKEGEKLLIDNGNVPTDEDAFLLKHKEHRKLSAGNI